MKKERGTISRATLREGKESLVEKKCNLHCLHLLQKIGAKARSVLGSLVEFFNTILLGFMGLKRLNSYLHYKW